MTVRVPIRRHPRHYKNGRVGAVTAHARRLPINLNSNFFRHNPQSLEMTTMSPDEFFALLDTTPAAWRESRATFDPEGYEQLSRALDSGRPVDDPLYLRVNVKNGMVIGHEGRHRMLYAKERGIAEVPVMLEYVDPVSHTHVDIRPNPYHYNRFRIGSPYPPYHKRLPSALVPYEPWSARGP